MSDIDLSKPLTDSPVELGGGGVSPSAQLKEVYFCCWSDSLSDKYKYNNLINLLKNLCLLVGCRDYAFIIHNKDYNDNGELKKEHIHVLMRFNKKISTNRLSKIFCISDTIIFKLENLSLCLRYMTHIDYPNKYQYDVNDIQSNIPQYDKLITGELTEWSLAYYYLIDFIKSYKHFCGNNPSLNICLDTLIKGGYSQFARSSIYLITQLLK